MDKYRLLQQIIAALGHLHESAIAGAKQAHDTATHEETVAENKYDTFGLEASYLAQGQSRRVAECAADLAAYRAMELASEPDTGPIKVSSLVTVTDEDDLELKLVLGPAAGGVKIPVDGGEVVIVTPASPLGQALLGKDLDEEFEVKIGDRIKQYIIERVE